MIRVIVKCNVKPEKIIEFVETTDILVRESNKEKGCIEYVLVKHKSKENTYCFIEQWETMEDLKNHMNAEHSKKYGPITHACQVTDPEIDIYE